jgi:hypothetical protein
MASAVIALQHATQSGLIHACLPSTDRRYDPLPYTCLTVIEEQPTKTALT